MSRRSIENLAGIPQRPYDLLREGLIMLGVIVVIIFTLAGVFSSPDYPTVRAEDVAKLQPIAYLKTSANILAGNSSVQHYGPPYTNDTENTQEVAGIAPAAWFGTTIPINASQDFIINPLKRAGVLNRSIADALREYEAASFSQRKKWQDAYLHSLDRAKVSGDRIIVPNGDYGPVGVMMAGMLNLGRSGLLEGALESDKRLPYSLDFTRSLLFFQDDVYHGVAGKLDMLGRQWGISHETGSYPGAWWLWPYTFLYQIPPMSSSPDGDLQIVFIMGLVFIIMLFIPFIPIINQLPQWLGIYKLIWRDWYKRSNGTVQNIE